jgi:hypothetical protein
MWRDCGTSLRRLCTIYPRKSHCDLVIFEKNPAGFHERGLNYEKFHGVLRRNYVPSLAILLHGDHIRGEGSKKHEYFQLLNAQDNKLAMV